MRGAEDIASEARMRYCLDKLYTSIHSFCIALGGDTNAGDLVGDQPPSAGADLQDADKLFSG